MRHVETVTAELELDLVVPGGPSLPVVASLSYHSADPWAVRVAFHTGGPGDGVVEWMLARQLLTDGVAGPVGDGDIRIWPALHGSDRVINLAMASPSGAALFELERAALVQFVERTYRVVPAGREGEVVDFDAELAVLLAA